MSSKLEPRDGEPDVRHLIKPAMILGITNRFGIRPARLRVSLLHSCWPIWCKCREHEMGGIQHCWSSGNLANFLVFERWHWQWRTRRCKEDAGWMGDWTNFYCFSRAVGRLWHSITFCGRVLRLPSGCAEVLELGGRTPAFIQEWYT